MLSCNKDKDEGKVTVIPGAFTSDRLLSRWRLMYIDHTEYVDGVQVSARMVQYEHSSDSICFFKGDSCIAMAAGKRYHATYKAEKNVIYTPADSFGHIDIDSGTYKIETYRLWINKLKYAYTDGEGKEHKLYAQHFFVD
ncbi:MAG TPA: hypothetical protein VL092_13755 [Chitinophagaceae bacterium]|nr:hypothetical protein [Chitinophagaceae bacterium]